MKKWQIILIAVILVIAVTLGLNHRLVWTLLHNMFPPHVELDTSEVWAGGSYERVFYGESEAQYIDLYVPSGVERPQLFVMIHGGGFIMNDAQSRQAQFYYRYFRDHGFACASVNYRLADESPFPAACDDVSAAVNYLADNAERFGFDADKIVIWGESAGGHLATREALTETGANIAVLVSYYGAYDLRAAEEQFIAQGVPKWIRDIANSWTNGHLGGYNSCEEYWLRKNYADWTEEDVLAASVQNIAENTAANPSLKTLLVVGNADITVPTQQTLDMERALIARYGAENVRLDLFDGAIHADDSMYTDEYLAKVESYIREALK